MNANLFGSDLWRPGLDKYAEATGLTVQLFDAGGMPVLGSMRLTPLIALLREYGFEPGVFSECAARCLHQTAARPAVIISDAHGLTVVGTSLALEGEIVGAAVAGYALARFIQVPTVQRWARSAGVPFDRLWTSVRGLAPVPERRLTLHGELLQVLGDALLRENFRTRQYEDTVEKLQAASAAKDDFLAVLSHELRTPLSPIAGWASLMRKSENLDQVHRAAEAIERNAFLQGRMIDELLDMNQLARGAMKLDLEILDLADVIRTAVEARMPALQKKSIRLELINAGEPLCIEGDAGRLQQIFGNILSNAVKFTPADGSIRVSLSREAEQARVVVADTGKGIAPEFLPFVFDIFRQQEQGTHRSNEGLGIGLSLVKKLTELHKGSVSIASAGPGRGAEVTVHLPLTAAMAEPGDAGEPSGAALAGLFILVVEDVKDAREFLQLLLELLGASVSAARDGQEALDMVARGARPDVILCDLLMPRLDGFEFMRELDARLPLHSPVIAVSGLGSETSRERARQAGFAGYLKKPFDEAGVIASVRTALARHQETAAAGAARSSSQTIAE